MPHSLESRFRKWVRTGKTTDESMRDFYNYGLIGNDEYDSPITTDKGRALLNQ